MQDFQACYLNKNRFNINPVFVIGLYFRSLKFNIAISVEATPMAMKNTRLSYIFLMEKKYEIHKNKKYIKRVYILKNIYIYIYSNINDQCEWLSRQ